MYDSDDQGHLRLHYFCRYMKLEDFSFDFNYFDEYLLLLNNFLGIIYLYSKKDFININRILSFIYRTRVLSFFIIKRELISILK